jgi:CDP-6-deoxy-D-xylo-4-hexulose-3-dehydrase
VSNKKEDLQNILNLVEDYIDNYTEEEWSPGKWIKYAGPYFDASEYTNAIKSLLSGWLVLGAEATKFENVFPKKLGKNFGLLTNSGSSANLLMMSALKSKNLYNLPPGTKVLTPIAGFPTTINPIFQVGFEPVFVDIELDTMNIDLELAEEALQNHDIKVITFAHVLGNPPNMDKLMKLVRKYDLILLEDCCDALGSFYGGQPLGSFGDMASCSFYPAHHITMGEGGFVATNTPEQERVVRSFREWGRACYCVGKANLGAKGSCGKRFSAWLPSLPDHIFDHKYVYSEMGYNMKPIELQAAIGLAQMKKLKEIGSLRRRNHAALNKIFEKYEQFFHLPKATLNSDPDWFAYALTIRDNSIFSRSEFCTFLESRKIQTRPYFAGNVMLQPAYSEYASVADVISKYPVARKVTTDTFFLGCSPVITMEKIAYIETVVEEFMEKNTL